MFFNKEDFQKRHLNLQVQMQDHGLEALLIAGGSNLFYFTGYDHSPHDRLICLCLPAEGDPFLLCPDFEWESIEEEIQYGFGQLLTWKEYEDPYQILGTQLSDKGYNKIGIDEHFPFWQFDRIAKSYGSASYVNGDKICRELRSIKSIKEQAYMRRASEISLQVHEEAFAELCEGMFMSELESLYKKLHIQKGMYDTWGGGSFAHTSSFIHGSIQDISLKSGMVILADAGAKYKGYYSDISRTVVFGKPSEEVKTAWSIAKECQIAGMDALKPGEPCESVDLEIRRVLESNNYKPSYKYLPHRVGHGLGIDIHEWPFLVEGSKDIIKPGMVFAFDGAFYVGGKFGIRLEDNYLITENGFEVFGNKQATSIDMPFG